MTTFFDALSSLAQILFAVVGGLGIYALIEKGYMKSLDLKGRVAVMTAGTILATMAASGIGILNGAGQFAYVILVAMAWVIAWSWLKGGADGMPNV